MTEAILDTGAPTVRHADRAASPPVTDSTARPKAPADKMIGAPGVALRNAPSDPSERRTLADALGAVRRAVSVAALLRTVGAAAIVGSLSLFLLQGFDLRGDFSRVLTLLALSALMALGGLAVGFALREPKGARVFLTLCLVSVPANFAVLGAMLYSIAPLDQAVATSAYPAFALWEASSLAEAGRALGLGLALLVPLTAFGFAVLARRSALPLAAALLGGSATLLVPLRDPALMAIAAGVVLTAVVTFVARSHRRARRDGRPMTFEERLAHALLLIPPAILLGRSVLVHGIDVDAGLPIAMAVYYLCHGLVGRDGVAVGARRAIAAFGAVAGATTAALLVALLPGTSSPALLVPLFVALAGALLLPLGRRTGEDVARRTVGALWSTLAVLSLGPLAFAGDDGATTLVASVAIALLVIGHGVAAGGVVRTVVGALALVGVLWTQAGSLIELVLGGGWIALAAIGVGTILAGSLLERFGPALTLRAGRHYGRTERAETDDIDVAADEVERHVAPSSTASSATASAARAA